MLKRIILLSVLFFSISCGSIISYDYPIYNEDEKTFSTGTKISETQFSTTLLTTHLGLFKIGSEEPYKNIESKLLDENPEYDFIINPKTKSKVVPIIPFIYYQKMDRLTARLGVYTY